MKQEINAKNAAFSSGSLLKRMLTGAAIGLFLISLFLFMAGAGDPVWGKFWRIRPLIIVPLAGAAGGFCYHFLQLMHTREGWNKVVVTILGVAIFIIGLWLGTVLGLDGTMWN